MTRARSNPRFQPGTWPLIVLVVWSLYVWATRISNAAADPTIRAGSKAFSIGLSLSFIVLAVAGLVILVRAWSRPKTNGEVLIVRLFAGWTIVVWLVRIPMIVLADHVPSGSDPAAFKTVHAVLGLISIGLATLVWLRTHQGATGAESVPAVTAR